MDDNSEKSYNFWNTDQRPYRGQGYEAELCLLWIASRFRNKDALFVLLLFFQSLLTFTVKMLKF